MHQTSWRRMCCGANKVNGLAQRSWAENVTAMAAVAKAFNELQGSISFWTVSGQDSSKLNCSPLVLERLGAGWEPAMSALQLVRGVNEHKNRNPRGPKPAKTVLHSAPLRNPQLLAIPLLQRLVDKLAVTRNPWCPVGSFGFGLGELRLQGPNPDIPNWPVSVACSGSKDRMSFHWGLGACRSPCSWRRKPLLWLPIWKVLSDAESLLPGLGMPMTVCAAEAVRFLSLG